MTHFDRVTTTLRDLKYMNERQAAVLRDFIAAHECADILEIGFFSGKSSAYIAAILEDRGRGHLTTIDKLSAKRRTPNIDATLESVQLAHRVTPIFAHRSYTWELGKLIRRAPRPQFDLCYFDGGHTWDETGLGFLLVDMLLKPGGWIVFDDLDWTINKSLTYAPGREKRFARYSDDEKAAAGVRMVFETIVPHLGYRPLSRADAPQWGFAQKPV